ncbi:MAG: hypothetical protein PHY40_03040 [Patescibacteria group bacterium]|nr:hypothetical protein [Patescibacteria group bacterium]
MNKKALSMDDPKRRLVKLEELIPNATDGVLYDFGRYLADYLNPELVPIGFVVGCELALHDLQAGVNGSGKPISCRLVGYPPVIYILLRMEIPRIADAIFPPSFASEVKKIIDKMAKSSKIR